MMLPERCNLEERLKELKKGFYWKDTRGNKHQPKDMATRHIFNSLRMIWNHRMPVEARDSTFKHYQLSGFYSEDYLTQAIKQLSSELSTRTNLNKQQTDWLQAKCKFLATEQLT